jgi:hypothetical protein
MYLSNPFHFGFHGGHSAIPAFLGAALIGLFVYLIYSSLSVPAVKSEPKEDKKGESA